jgi:stress-induced-phosphoprotein 1
LKKFNEAVSDAEKCIEIKPDWSKGYQRKGMALHGLRNYEDAIKAFE